MPEPWQHQPPIAPRQAVATKIQDLVAARLGRGFVPLALLFVTGLAQSIFAGPAGPHGPLLAAGAIAAAGAMLAYGLRIVQLAFGRPHRVWMSVSVWVGLVPLGFAIYVLGWRGLRVLADGSLGGFGVGLVFALLGTWVIRTWMKVVEVERLARIMSMGLDEEVGTA